MRTTWLVLCCKFGNSLLVVVSIPPIANTLYWPLDGSSPLPGNSILFKLLQIPSVCLATLCLHSYQFAFLVHPSVIPILKSTKCVACFASNRVSNASKKALWQLAELSSWEPRGAATTQQGLGHMCHNLVKTCLSHAIQGHVSSMRGSEQKMSPDFEMCNVRLPSDSHGKSRVEMAKV